MSLDDILLGIMQSKEGSILIVDDFCDFNLFGDIAYDHVPNEEEIEKFAREKLGIDPLSMDSNSKGNTIFIRDFTHDQIHQENSTYKTYKQINPNPDVILVNANQQTFVNLADLLKSISTFKKLEKEFPESEVILYFPNYEHEALNNTIKHVTKTLGFDLDEMNVKYFSQKTYPTLMHMLCYEITGTMHGRHGRESLSALQHEYKNQMWDNYVNFIDTSLNNGNQQTHMPYQFLILSDREKILLGEYQPNNRKVTVAALDEEVNQDLLDKCAAIFVDNSWEPNHPTAMGNGIERLRKLRTQLRDRQVPIIYQTGHPLSKFSEQEKQELKDLGAILATKDLFPKVCRGQTSAQKESNIGELVKHNSQLKKYVSQVYDFNNGNLLGENETFVVCSKIVDETKEPNQDKLELFKKLGITDGIFSHRMYVLSMLHTELKTEVNNPTFKPTVKQFFSYDRIKEELGDLVEPFEKVYTNITKNKAHYEKRTITHNDAKEDNWFASQVLGDFSGAAPGPEYKDLARSMLDEEDEFTFATDISKVDEQINNYFKLRTHADSEFTLNSTTFRRRVHEAMLTESLRLACFMKKDYKKREKVEGYLKVAKTYHESLQQNS
ncbi:hypothetical protein HN587_07415 [Candidatus Woesearchaeota archaeon]|jgi:hypothetical protein|nr:hypothetical protein [Candidatus Woesearchaeota archaeon]